MQQHRKSTTKRQTNTFFKDNTKNVWHKIYIYYTKVHTTNSREEKICKFMSNF